MSGFQGRDILSIRDLSRADIQLVLRTARKMVPIATGEKRSRSLEGKILSTLFYEPSTRTRLSFESAMARLGGRVVGFNSAEGTSVQKGETLADTSFELAVGPQMSHPEEFELEPLYEDPIVLFVVCSSIVFLLLTFVVPKIVKQFETSNAQLPALTQALIGFSNFTRDWGLIILVALAAGGYLFNRALRDPAIRRRFADTQARIANALRERGPEAASLPVQRPLQAKLLVVDDRGNIRHWARSKFVDLLRRGDLVIANDAATLPASLFGQHLPSGRSIEVRLAARRSHPDASAVGG